MKKAISTTLAADSALITVKLSLAMIVVIQVTLLAEVASKVDPTLQAVVATCILLVLTRATLEFLY